jgi:hypothetical protein
MSDEEKTVIVSSSEHEEDPQQPDIGLIILGNMYRDEEDDKKDLGIPCPLPGTVPSVEAKAIVLRCVVCRENQIQTVNFPCMHACFCVNCASPSLNHSKTCAQCRTAYMHISMLYLCSGDPTEEDIEPFRKRRRTE